jgi:hypothetical protein
MTWPMPTIVASVFMKAPAFGIGVPKTIGDSRRGSSVSRYNPAVLLFCRLFLHEANKMSLHSIFPNQPQMSCAKFSRPCEIQTLGLEGRRVISQGRKPQKPR